MSKRRLTRHLKYPDKVDQVVREVFMEALRPNAELTAHMIGEVTGKFDITWGEAYRMMLAEYVRRTYNIELVESYPDGR